jgi:hypothetical protein
MAEAFAIEAFSGCFGDTGYEALAIAVAHVGFEFEEVFQSQCFQDWATVLAAHLAGVEGIGASAAGKIEVAEIELSDRAATLTNEQRTRPIIPSEASATPTQFDGLSMARKVICLNGLRADDQVFHERIAKWHFQTIASTPIGHWRKYAEAAQVGNINSGQLLDNWPRPFLWSTLSSRQLGRHCHLNSIALCDLLEAGDQIIIRGNCGLDHAGGHREFVNADLR